MVLATTSTSLKEERFVKTERAAVADGAAQDAAQDVAAAFV